MSFGSPTDPRITFRDTVRKLSPKWLQSGYGERLLYAMTVPLDALGDAVIGAVKARWPGVYTNESLGLIGRERRIRRGRTESDATYAARLRRWLDDHATRGGPYAMLYQLYAHYAPSNFRIDLVYRSGRRFVMATDGSIARDDVSGAASSNWARWTLYMFWPTSVTSDGLWSTSGLWSDGGVWDSSLSPDDVTDLRLIPKEWNAAHCSGRIILLTASDDLWDYPPGGTWADPGTWLPLSQYPVTLSLGSS